MLLSLSSKKIGPVALAEAIKMNESVTTLEKAIDNPFFHLVDFIVAPSQACLTMILTLLALWQLQRQSIAL
jgi:uncharacterized membrane protein